MKCPSCHAPLMIEDEHCPYCGNENPYFTQHREDLKDFTEEFEETHQEVLKKVRRTSRISVNITIICVLIILNIFTWIGMIFSWNIEYVYERWYINQHEEEVRATLEAYSDAGDVLGLSSYCDYQLQVYGTNIEDYYKVELAAKQYTYLYRDIMHLTVLAEESYETSDELCESISANLVYFYDAIQQDTYDNDAYFTEEHVATLTMMQTQLETLVEYYLNIPSEEIPALLELSEARRAIAIEEGVFGNETE